MPPRPPLDALIGEPLPDLSLLDPSGAPFRLRGRAEPLALFFYIRNGTPG